LIIATAGHVDHGKTSLIKQLTGVDTDRLEEEKRRGLSINLGFAYHPLSNGSQLAFIDVPGHTRFINTMISGVSGIDLGMLVVAADDGPMPQTQEHLDVLRLLGLKNLVTVISKVDRVTPERVQAVQQQLAGLLGELSGETFVVSNTSGAGIDALRVRLEQLALYPTQRSAPGNFRLSIDRAFNLRGIGLVLTGTASAGEISIGDVLQLQPQAIDLRIRSLRVHDRPASCGRAGQRCALNVVGDIERDQIVRGNVLVAATDAPATNRFDAQFSLLASAPFALKQLSPVKLYIGARQLAACVYFIDPIKGGRLLPGDRALVQFMAREPIPCCRGERFVVRDHSESVTLGGGMVLDPLAPKSGKARAHRLHYLQAMQAATAEQSLAALLANPSGEVSLDKFRRSWNLSKAETEALKARCDARAYLYENEIIVVVQPRWRAACNAMVESVEQFHSAYPEQPGINIVALRQQCKVDLSAGLFRAGLAELLQQRRLSLTGSVLHTPGYQPLVSRPDQQRWQRLKAIFRQHGTQLPLVSELVTSTGWDKATVLASLQQAQRRGLVVKLNDNRYALPDQLLDLAQGVLQLANTGNSISVVNYKNAIAAGRKLSIEILEYFDRIHFTRRQQEHRVILDATLPQKRFTQ
jgi:selenocysteine-specific elongation factor